jgi:hypothetical protein
VQKPILCFNPHHALSPALFACPSLLHKNNPKSGKAGEGEFTFFRQRFFRVGVPVAWQALRALHDRVEQNDLKM